MKKLYLTALFVIMVISCGGKKTDIIIEEPEGSWLRGDFHAHSTHSDGDSPIAEIVDYIERAGFDFFALTDHDSHMGGNPRHWDDPVYVSDSVTLLYGIEWTSPKGHANIFSHTPFEYGQIWEANRQADPPAAVQSTRAQGAFFSINHPSVSCCPWGYPFFGTDFIEIWNGPFLAPSRNGKTVTQIWDPLLISGRRITGIGGSDNHQLKGFRRRFNPPGYPTTWVFVETGIETDENRAGSAAGGERVLEGVAAGRVSIGYSPDMDRIVFSADRDRDGAYETGIGGTILKLYKEISFAVSVEPPAGGTRWHRKRYDLRIIKNGRIFLEERLLEDRRRVVAFTDVPGERSYYRVELWGRPKMGPLASAVMGDLLAMSNPIYAGYEQ